jgi:hypothetical protein
LAHYWGGREEGDEKRAEILCAYLGHPKSVLDPPTARAQAREVLQVLSQVWDESKSPGLHEDVAIWIALIVTKQAKDWKAEDVPTLRGYSERLRKDKTNSRAQVAANVIDGIIATLISLPPLVQTLLAFGIVNVFALLLFVLRPGRWAAEKWLPFAGYIGAGLGSWPASVLVNLQLNLWLLGGLLVAELVLLLALGLVSLPWLRQVAKIEPLNRVAVPLALCLPGSRRRIFEHYVQEVQNQLERDKRQANEERYFALPADVRSSASPAPAPRSEPAAEILTFLTGSAGERGHVLIEAPGGRGKSALLREVVRQALERFKASPASAPLPVLLTGSGEDIEKMVEGKLASVLLAPELLGAHLEAGDFFLILDGVSESGLPDKVLDGFVHGKYRESTPLLLSSRPDRAYRHIIEGTAHWRVVEPRRLDEATLDKFVAHYGGRELPEPLKAACRGPDGYLPILVRMAMTLGADDKVGVSVADVYFRYFLRLFEAQIPEREERARWLEEVSRWCLETYWKDSLRRIRYSEGSQLQEKLRKAGILVPADNMTPPNEVQFFHDSMQSYLTAYGLALQDKEGYSQLPRPVDDPTTKPWDRSRVLLWAAGYPKFVRAGADLLQTGGTELFQMCLATFATKEGMRRWLRDELLKWAKDHKGNLRQKDVLAAIPPQLNYQTRDTHGARILTRAAAACFDADQQSNSLAMLGALYAGIAPLVYELKEGADENGPESGAAA